MGSAGDWGLYLVVLALPVWMGAADLDRAGPTACAEGKSVATRDMGTCVTRRRAWHCHYAFGNLYSNLDLLLHGRAEWQAPAVSAASVWQEGFDKPFMLSSIAVLGTAIVTAWAFRSLARVSRRRRSAQEARLA